MHMFSDKDAQTILQAVPREKAISGGKSRRFQVDLKPKGILEGGELIAELARQRYGGNTSQAEMALMMVEGFILEKLSEGYRIDTRLATFAPRLSGALSTRDADPETDGLYVQGTVSARGALRHALAQRVKAVNSLEKRLVRILSVYDEEAKRYDEIVMGHTLSIVGSDALVDPANPDEGFWLEKRSGHWNRKPKVIQRAEILEAKPSRCKIVFREPVERGIYNLVVATRCGEGRDYRLRRVGHPVQVV